MNDYMTALLDRFGIPSPKAAETEEQVRAAEQDLKEQLGKEQWRLLLRLTDLHNACREEARLSGFISGYRLAAGIHGELDEHPRFSIVAEDEERAQKIFEQEWGEQNGEAPGER